ncbi:sialate O-acetylesterase [Sphingobacterium hotanense]|uniref:sialate O-acetylesterase n=1 Tax=Sphingobacterium hotanense TaxID=649196 RepID=UPI0021A47F50|nr:sialate O-acetylesterase [Sphingobacterium hotanense]MCT1524247.1 sialate O-acetylesterase [Sphingobacterium hotanense]
MKLKSLTLGIIASIAMLQTAVAQLRLPHFLSDHMVLQRNTEINFWGWGGANRPVKVIGSWFKDTVSTKVDYNGKWTVKLPEGQAGGPYQVKIISNNETINLNDILLGDVFLCSGQSNMEWGGNQNLKEIMDELPTANNPNIRLLQVSRIAANYPQEDINNSWTTLSAETLKPFSAIGYFIAKELNKELNVPIGVINASWGGTGAEVWTPNHLIVNDPFLLKYAKMQDVNPYRPHEGGVLWNSMIHPYAGYNLTAAYWYQGESNVGYYPSYDKLMKALVTAWRNAWNNDFPFYFVQIAPYAYNSKDEPKGALLRELQSKTALELQKTGMVVITDLVDDVKNIHPNQKKEVAKRLSDMTLAEVYDKPIKNYKSPIYKSHEIKGNNIEVTFYYAEGGLNSKGDITELEIAGADNKYYPAKGTIKGDKLIVQSKEVKNPVSVKFGFSETAMPNLFNSRGLPVSPFRF